jgi:hypothetical protein
MPQDYTEAAKWLNMAAEQGNASAQMMLGVMYEKGQGVPQDYVQAHKWYSLSASIATGVLRGMAEDNREGVAEHMTPEQIAEAERLAREWTAKRE